MVHLTRDPCTADARWRTLRDVDDASAPEGHPVDQSRPPERRRPFGVLVVALIQLATVAFALVGALTSWVMPWEGIFVTYVQEHTWARLVILGLGVLVVVAVVGMWRLRYWGWALMVSLVGASLLFDLMTWWQAGAATSLPAYVRLALDVVSAFYLNTRAVQDAFRSPPDPEPLAPIAGTRSAGRVDP